MNRATKETNIRWIGQIPLDWSLGTIGNECKVRNEKVSDKDYQPLSVTKNGILSQLEHVAKSDDNDNRKLVLRNDFVINSRSDRKNSCGISSFNGSVSLINTVLYRKDNSRLENNYIAYLFKNYGFAEEFYRWGHGIVADLWTTGWEEMKRITIPVPPKEEQIRIARAIKNQEEKINALITNEEKQIEKLRAYKQALISEVVTKGLDPNAPMKDSAVESIGYFPSNWQLLRAKYVFDSFTKGQGITKDQVVTDGNVSCIRYGEIYSKYDISFSQSYSKTKFELVTSQQFASYGDILFAGTGELIEEIGKNIVYLGHEPILVGGDIIIGKHRQVPEFLNYAMSCVASQSQKSKGKSKLKVVHISADEISNIFVVVPPIEEQKKLVDYLDSRCSLINKLIEGHVNKITKLVNYRKCLIYEYITGRKEAK